MEIPVADEKILANMGSRQRITKIIKPKMT